MTGLLDFSDRTVVITGGASGIGAAAVEQFGAADAHIHVLDVAPSTVSSQAEHYECDLGNRSSIDAAIAALPGRVDVLVNCAGVPNGGRFSVDEVMTINWLGLRHLTEALLPRIEPRGAVVHVSSTAGRDWVLHETELRSLLAADTFEAGQEWVRANSSVCGDGYSLSKEAVQWYTMTRALETRPAGVRMNSICPGVTNTRLVDDFRRGVGADVLDRAVSIAGRMAEPSEMAPALLFLTDDASSSFINGLNLVIDGGSSAARATSA